MTAAPDPSCVLTCSGTQCVRMAAATVASGYVTASKAAQPPQVGEKKSSKTSLSSAWACRSASSKEVCHRIVDWVVLLMTVPLYLCLAQFWHCLPASPPPAHSHMLRPAPGAPTADQGPAHTPRGSVAAPRCYAGW